MADPITVTSLSTVTVDVASASGNGFVGKAQILDYTAGTVAAAYQEDVKRIGEILNGTPTNQQGPLTALSTADAEELSARISELKNLFVNGVTAPIDPSNPGLLKTQYLTTDMATNLQLLFTGLRALGVNVSGNTITLSTQDAINLRNLSTSSLVFDPLFNYAATAIAQNQSTQAMVELHFVKQGNDLLSNALTKLQQALKATQTVLGQLGQLQEVHNQVMISGKGNFSPSVFDVNITSATSPSAYMAAYQKAASGFFGSLISPTTSLFPANSAFFPAQVPADTAILNPSSTLTYADISARAAAILAGANTAGINSSLTISPPLAIPTNPPTSISNFKGVMIAQRLASGSYVISKYTLSGLVQIGVSSNFNNFGDHSNIIQFVPNTTYSSTFSSLYGLTPTGMSFTVGGSTISGTMLKVSPSLGSAVGAPPHDITADVNACLIVTNPLNVGSITINNPSPLTYTTFNNVTTSGILDALGRIAPEASISIVAAKNNISSGTGILKTSEMFEHYQGEFSKLLQDQHIYKASLTRLNGDFAYYSVTNVATGAVIATDVNLFINTGSYYLPPTIMMYPRENSVGAPSEAFQQKYVNTNPGFPGDNGFVDDQLNAILGTTGTTFRAVYSNIGLTTGDKPFLDSSPPFLEQDIKAFQTVANANSITISGPGLTTFPSYGSDSNLVASINYLNGRGFNVKVDTPSVTSGFEWLGLFNGVFKVDPRGISDFTDLQTELASIRGILSAQIPILSSITSAINVTTANPNGQVDPNSLLGRLKVVLGDLNKVFVKPNGQPITSGTSIISALTGMRAWLLDNYNQRGTPNATLAGQIQHNITNAVTSGQSLNDTQQSNVRNFLFVFQQYYQAASTVLQQITQIIQRMASAINR